MILSVNMPMQPPKKEQYTVARISPREAHLLSELRMVGYGEVIVFKANNLIIRVQLGKSVLIDEKQGEKCLKELQNVV